MDRALVPADVVAEVEKVQADILAGLFRVNVNDAEPVSTR
jgi:hypothetical protein